MESNHRLVLFKNALYRLSYPTVGSILSMGHCARQARLPRSASISIITGPRALSVADWMPADGAGAVDLLDGDQGRTDRGGLAHHAHHRKGTRIGASGDRFKSDAVHFWQEPRSFVRSIGGLLHKLTARSLPVRWMMRRETGQSGRKGRNSPSRTDGRKAEARWLAVVGMGTASRYLNTTPKPMQDWEAFVQYFFSVPSYWQQLSFPRIQSYPRVE